MGYINSLNAANNAYWAMFEQHYKNRGEPLSSDPDDTAFAFDPGDEAEEFYQNEIKRLAAGDAG